MLHNMMSSMIFDILLIVGFVFDTMLYVFSSYMGIRVMIQIMISCKSFVFHNATDLQGEFRWRWNRAERRCHYN